MAETAVDRYKKALEAAEGIKQQAVDEIMQRVNSGIEELRSFGMNYTLSEDGVKKPVKKRAGKAAEQRFCNICQIAGHDGRYHRNQAEKKRFTKRELEERGLPPA